MWEEEIRNVTSRLCDDVFKTAIKCVSQNYKYHAKFRFHFEWFNVRKNGGIHMGI